jgi:hypothetical protein
VPVDAAPCLDSVGGERAPVRDRRDHGSALIVIPDIPEAPLCYARFEAG